MKRIFALVAAAALLAGCQSPQPAYNPFSGPTVVPPPGTAVPPPGQPYYGSPAGAPLLPPSTNVPPPTSSTIRPGAPNFAPVPAGGMSSSFTPNVSPQPPAAFPAPASAAPISSNPVPASGFTAQTRPVYGPPGGNALPQRVAAPMAAGGPMMMQASAGQPTLAQAPPSGWSAPAAASAASSNGQVTAAAASVPSTNVSSAGRGTVTPASFTTPSPAIRIVDPPASSLTTASLSPSTAPSKPASRVPEIGELPAFSGRSSPIAGSLPPAAAPTAARAGSGSSGTVWNRPSTAPSSSDLPAAGFGYDSQYRWLKGKLEYSQATQTWRLRYIPPDGATDNYGGSVILSDASRLGGLKPGDLVYAEGTPGTAGATAGSFAPVYTLARIAKQ